MRWTARRNRRRTAPRDGRYVTGELNEADPELCLGVAQPRPPSHHRLGRVADVSGEY